jgi:hypothetical protein
MVILPQENEFEDEPKPRGCQRLRAIAVTLYFRATNAENAVLPLI